MMTVSETEAIELSRNYRVAIFTVGALDERLAIATALLRDVQSTVSLPPGLAERIAVFMKNGGAR